MWSTGGIAVCDVCVELVWALVLQQYPLTLTVRFTAKHVHPLVAQPIQHCVSSLLKAADARKVSANQHCLSSRNLCLQSLCE